MGRTAGAVDGADHIGACLGALLAGVALVPVVGMTVTCVLLAWLKLTSVGLLAAWRGVEGGRSQVRIACETDKQGVLTTQNSKLQSHKKK